MTDRLLELAERWEDSAIKEATTYGGASPSIARKAARDILAMFEVAAALRAKAQEQSSLATHRDDASHD